MSLSQTDAWANLAVKDLGVARKFYEHALGLKQVGSEREELLVFGSGGTNIFVYKSDAAGTNKATAVTWVTADVDGLVKQLKAKGIKFEHYDMPDMVMDGDVHVNGDMRVAWFKDPDGNILNIASG